jgi:hypothetical protein
MGETDDRTESEGKGLFIIRNDQRLPSTRLISGCRYFRESSSATQPVAFRLKCRTKAAHPHRKGPLAMDKTVEVIALYASATQNALVTLSKCLMDNGALKPGQFSSVFKSDT